MTIITDRKKGFTLAEVLITLTIIGVVAALTIPSLLANVNDKTYETKRKGLETRLAQAFSQIESINSYKAVPPSGDSTDPNTYAEDNSSMNFVTEALAKVYKITNVCEFENFAACDFPDKFTYWAAGSAFTTSNLKLLSGFQSNNKAENFGGLLTKAVAVRTKNGESFLLWYNPNCVSEQEVDAEYKKNWRKEVCAALLVDLDGSKKGPNSMGRDIHMGALFYPDTPYFVLPDIKFHAVSGSLPSYSDSTGATATAEKYCAEWNAQGYPKGSYTLMSRAEYKAITLCYWNYPNVWTTDVEGAGPDDYGWMGAGTYERLVPRSTDSSYLLCKIKDGR